jgi:hypothetical protein
MDDVVMSKDWIAGNPSKKSKTLPPGLCVENEQPWLVVKVVRWE